MDIADGSQFYVNTFVTQIKTAILAGLDDIVFPTEYDPFIQIPSYYGGLWF